MRDDFRPIDEGTRTPAGTDTEQAASETRISIPVRAWMGEDSTRRSVTVRAMFDPRDPYAVTLLCNRVPWRFARSLLSQVLTDPWCEPADRDPVSGRPEHGEPVGLGDVVLQREHPALHPEAERTVRMTLRSPSGAADIYLELTHLVAFCRAVDRRVPEGTEHLDWGSIIARLVR